MRVAALYTGSQAEPKAVHISGVTSSGPGACCRAPTTTVTGATIEDGQVTPVIDRCYPLEQAPEALRFLEEDHARGKIVITVA